MKYACTEHLTKHKPHRSECAKIREALGDDYVAGTGGDDSDCVDDNEKVEKELGGECDYFAGQGECEKHKEWMESHCPAACCVCKGCEGRAGNITQDGK